MLKQRIIDIFNNLLFILPLAHYNKLNAFENFIKFSSFLYINVKNYLTHIHVKMIAKDKKIKQFNLSFMNKAIATIVEENDKNKMKTLHVLIKLISTYSAPQTLVTSTSSAPCPLCR